MQRPAYSSVILCSMGGIALGIGGYSHFVPSCLFLMTFMLL